MDREALPGGLEAVERNPDRAPFILTKVEMKLLGIAGVGFFVDGSYIFF
jgi:hypothetical protein